MLFEHNYLVLPAFGGFVLKESPAYFSAQRSSLNAPAKCLGFNVQLKQNDGLLCHWLQNELGIGQADAMSQIRDFVDFCNSILSSRRRLTLNGIGFFYIDLENNLSFEPERDTNFSKDSFGLGSISLKPLKQEPIRRQPQFEDRRVPVTVNKSTGRRMSRYALPAAFSALFIALLAILVINPNTSRQLRASLLSDEVSRTYRPLSYHEVTVPQPGPASAYVTDANGIAQLQIGEKQVAVQVTDAEDAFEEMLHEGRFEIVLGCFSVNANAHKMVKQLARKNLKARISEERLKGLLVVSHGKFRNRDQAVEVLQRIKASYPAAWLREL